MKTLRERAITLMKDGRTPDELRVLFIAEGNDAEQVRSVLVELSTLQRRAATMDPARLRGEANWMFSHGASIDHVVAHFVQAGVPEAHARPEAERLHALFRTMRPCQRCGAPTPPGDLVFDLRGFSVCNSCNLRDEIQRSEQRAVVSDLESFAVFGGVGAVIAASAAQAAVDANAAGGTTTPFCNTCRAPTGVHVTTLPPEWRARLDPSWQWVCPRCWQRIA